MGFQIRVAGIGRRSEMLEEEILRYRTMTRPFADVDVGTIRPPLSRGADRSKVLAAEAKVLLAQLPGRCHPVALSDEGKQQDSAGFARWIDARRQDGVPLVFLIGGSHGLSSIAKGRCREVISLSRLTFSHRIAMIVLLEQIYRASTIITGHPYHK